MALFTNQKTVGTDAAQLDATARTYQELEIRNTHASQVLYVGASGVTASTGHAIPAGAAWKSSTPIDASKLYLIASGADTTSTWAGNT